MEFVTLVFPQHDICAFCSLLVLGLGAGRRTACFRLLASVERKRHAACFRLLALVERGLILGNTTSVLSSGQGISQWAASSGGLVPESRATFAAEYSMLMGGLRGARSPTEYLASLPLLLAYVRAPPAH